MEGNADTADAVVVVLAALHIEDVAVAEPPRRHFVADMVHYHLLLYHS